MSTFYFFYQARAKEGWQRAVATDRERIIRDLRPELVTILDVDYSFPEEKDPDVDLTKLRYRGPLYFDFDNSDINDVIIDVKQFLNQLRKDYDVSLECLNIFASGGKGFHVEIPIQVVADRNLNDGYVAMPLIQKELASILNVYSMDMVVYSRGHGRMWRTPGIQRPNGRYKVPLYVDEVFSMTPEMYEEITSSPRDPLTRPKPVYSPKLSAEWRPLVDKVTKSLAKKKKSRLDENLIKSWGGNWSSSMERLLNGEASRDGVGFNKIAIQLAISANALGKTDVQLLEDAAGLIANHESDGAYNTPEKRRRELYKQYWYMNDNSTYDFNASALRSVISEEVDTTDLTPAATIPGASSDDETIELHGTIVTSTGIFQTVEGEPRLKCSVGFSNPELVVDMTDFPPSPMGVTVDIVHDGVNSGRRTLWKSAFDSRAAFQKAVGQASMIAVHLTDPQVGSVMEALGMSAKKSEKYAFVINRVGMVVQDVPEQYRLRGVNSDVLWVSPDEILSKHRNADGSPLYSWRWVGPFGITEKPIQSDLMSAPRWLVDVPAKEAEAYLGKLFTMSSYRLQALWFGWFSACHFAVWIRREFEGRFPLFHPFGESGSGKTATASLALALHYYKMDRPVDSFDSSRFSLQAALCTSNTTPYVLDEYKFTQGQKSHMDVVQSLLRNSYSATAISKGTVDRKAGKGLSLERERLSTPICYMAEQQDTQTAMIERSIAVHMSKEDRRGRGSGKADLWIELTDPRQLTRFLGPLGKHIATKAMYMDSGEVRDAIDKIRRELTGLLGEAGVPADQQDDYSRFAHNYACVRFGLKVFSESIRELVGNSLDVHLDRMMAECVIDTPYSKNAAGEAVGEPVSMPKTELAQTLSAMALLSTGEAGEAYVLDKGKHYVVLEGSIDIKVPACYSIYCQYVRSIGQMPLFNNEISFVRALNRYAQMNPPNSPLLDPSTGTRTIIARLDMERMAKDNVADFRS